METWGYQYYGDSNFGTRDSPTLLVIGEMPNEHITKTATRT